MKTMFGKKSNSDKEIKKAIKDLRKGSAEAFKILFEKYRTRVYRFCLRMLGDPDQAQDAFQETFIRVYDHRMDFRGSNFSAWLFTIARHTCLNYIRNRKDHEQYDEVFHEVGHERETDVFLKDCIAKAVSTLPVTYREAILLREYEECSYQEIADILDIDISLAKVRVHRARVILRKLLAPIKQEIYES
jgi:RNA polymerase sigma-70 factor, ECF subfamily